MDSRIDCVNSSCLVDNASQLKFDNEGDPGLGATPGAWCANWSVNRKGVCPETSRQVAVKIMGHGFVGSRAGQSPAGVGAHAAAQLRAPLLAALYDTERVAESWLFFR